MKDLIHPIVSALVRHVIGWLGITHIFGQDEQTQIAGIIAVAISLGWSIWDKLETKRRNKNDNT